MSEQIDRPALSRRAGHILFTQGPEQPAATARETCILLDQLAQAEARIRAVEDVLDQSRDDITLHIYPEQLNGDIRQALDT